MKKENRMITRNDLLPPLKQSNKKAIKNNSDKLKRLSINPDLYFCSNTLVSKNLKPSN